MSWLYLFRSSNVTQKPQGSHGYTITHARTREHRHARKRTHNIDTGVLANMPYLGVIATVPHLLVKRRTFFAALVRKCPSAFLNRLI